MKRIPSGFGERIGNAGAAAAKGVAAALLVCLLGATLASCQSPSGNEGSQGQSTSLVVDEAAQGQPASDSTARAGETDAEMGLISAEELHGLIEQGTPPVIVDVRSIKSYTSASIAGSVNIPAGQQMEIRIDEIPEDTDVVLVDQRNDRASEAYQVLVGRGYSASSIRILDGGMSAWSAAGYPVETKAVRRC